ncbi:MAG: transcriptional regulator GcvA [Alphaproteobacteria bacterium]|nr:transcriptional regulator GcvA [Alphaproteobacteria bacterium]
MDGSGPVTGKDRNGKAPQSRWRRLPPLNALRAFEAAARHASFTKAAGELFVTPAAVSHQVKALEDFLGMVLFRRERHGLQLTDSGNAYLPGVREAFERLIEAMDELAAVGQHGVLTVSVAPSFAAKWLVPRLDGFQALHPDIDVRISASMGLTDFSVGDVDLAIRYGAGSYPGLESELLIRDTVYPVCSPELLSCDQPLTVPEMLRAHNLLHDDSPDGDDTCPTWPMWIKAAGLTGIDAHRGPRFNQASLVLEAAILGRGVALAKSTLADADIESGRLVKPFDLTLPVRFAYYMVHPRAKALLPKVQVFKEWLRTQVPAAA